MTSPTTSSQPTAPPTPGSPAYFAKLTEDFKAAHAKAVNAVRRVKDEGTCNSDSVGLMFKRMPHPSTRAKYDAALQRAGLSGFWSNAWYRTPMCIIGPNVRGQGAPQTVASEAMVEHLKAAGYDVMVRYMMN